MNKGYIYKLAKKGDAHIYIGSTFRSLQERLDSHKYTSKQAPERNVYKYISETGGWEVWNIVLVEEYECEDVKQLNSREELYRNIYNQDLILNTQKCYTGLTKNEYSKEYREKNVENVKKRQKEHYEKNKEKRNKQTNENYYKNKDRYRKQQKEYNEKHKEQLLKQYKEYRESHKEDIKKWKKEKIECPICGSIVTKGGIAKHKKTEKCIHFKEIYDFINHL